ncbi:C2H2-type domain-containing protein [Fusarium keratoplasticum]|uniref:C2H2-type domain-containing protein n=1 Tax=Fusarium keratoplasticum TaxID=1328300 RepID=A0ACC0QHJ5_9HYPO|nr:C2H2-type domain-containing protein [Fusarium keratoplasticum]KAI8652658.1 C2H2-type domain-containing protein [Fusarium keratoplasticum]
MFRLVESTDSSPAAQCSVSVRDSFGEGVYIKKNRSDGLCSTDCHCRRLGSLDFAFTISKQPAHTKIEVRNEILQNTLIDVIGSDEWHSQCDLPAWDGAHLFARYEGLKARLRDVIDAPVGSVGAQPFLPLRLLVDGFLGQEQEESLPCPQHKDPSDVLRDVLPGEDKNSMLDVKLLQAAGDGDISVIDDLLSNHTVLPYSHMQMFVDVLGRQITDDLFKETVNIDAHDESGNTALLRAVTAGHLDVARLLVARGADIAWANNQGETALHKAARADHFELSYFLIEVGADIDAKDNSGAAPAFIPFSAVLQTWRCWWEWVMPARCEQTPSERTINDYRDLLFKTDPIMNTDKVKTTMRGLFIREYAKVRQHLIFGRVRGRFPNSTRAWRFGMTALHKISHGYLPQELGMAIALLCVCKAVSATLHIHKHDSSNFQFDDEQFRRDLPRWLPLFHGADRKLFKAAARDIWSVRISMWTLYTPQTLDYHDLFKHAERLTSDLIDAVKCLHDLTEFAELGDPEHGQQRPSQQDRCPPKDPNPGDPGIGAESTQHRKAVTGRRASSQKSLLWAEVMAGAIFSILLIFLLWLYSLLAGTVQFIATDAASWHISVDAQSVARRLQSRFANTLTVERPPSIQSPTAGQDVVMLGQDSNDDHHVQPRGNPALSPSSGGVPDPVDESAHIRTSKGAVELCFFFTLHHSARRWSIYLGFDSHWRVCLNSLAAHPLRCEADRKGYYAIDYFPSRNPRGDGYQRPAGSSTGAGVCVSGYPWCDMAIGTDTTGSGREPARATGVQGLRLSGRSISMKGVVPSSEEFDSLAFLTRSLEDLVHFTRLSTGNKLSELPPTKILYPTDWLPYKIDGQQRLNEDFLAAMEQVLGVQHTKVSLTQLWEESPPVEAQGKSIAEYLENSGFWPMYYDNYHTFDDFRQGYEQKFGKPVYVSPSQGWKWELGSKVTEEQRAHGIAECEVFRDWVDKHVLTRNDGGHGEAVILLPLGNAKLDYRDIESGPPSVVKSYEPKYFGSILGVPQIVTPSSDVMLVKLTQLVLEKMNKPTSVLTGRECFSPETNGPVNDSVPLPKLI